jgi:putative transposase
MRFVFIEAEKANYPVRMLCRIMHVSRSGFYAWCERPESRRCIEDRRLTALIRSAHRNSRKCYGSPRVHRELIDQGISVGRHRVARLMRQDGLRGKRRRRFRVTTDSAHKHPVAPNVLARNFAPDGPNAVWASDLTYLWTNEGWLYLCVILDLYSRRVIGWSMSSRMSSEMVGEAFKMATTTRDVLPGRLVYHTDRGVQYASRAFRKTLEAWRFTPSMSRKGNCWDNAVVESFFATLKIECIRDEELKTRAQTRNLVFQYIEGFYNTKRRHSFLGYISPAEYEKINSARNIAR